MGFWDALHQLQDGWGQGRGWASQPANNADTKLGAPPDPQPTSPNSPTTIAVWLGPGTDGGGYQPLAG